MAMYDQDKNGVLCFDEFLQMVLTSSSFNFGLPSGSRELLMGSQDPEATAARNTLRALFDEADADSSGTLSTDELATVVKQYYRTEGNSRSAKAVQREVDEAMAVYDQDKNGVLCFDEFL